jgi:hypothetical protein
MNIAKDFVKSRYPHALYHYKDSWNCNSGRFRRIYSIYEDNELDAFSALTKKLGEGRTVEEAWGNARHNIEVGIR